MGKVANISLRKKLGLNLHAIQTRIETERHRLNYLMWECTLRCNLACKHCGSDCHKDPVQKDMPLEDFLRVVDSITPHVDTHNTMIVLTGGEPLMRKDLEKCGLELYKREYPWGIVSNGLAMTPQRIESLLNAGLRSVTISLDGLEQEHNEMRGSAESYRSAVKAIATLATKGDEIIFDVVTCVTQSNFGQLDQIRELLVSLGVKRWRVFTVFPIGRATQHDELQLPPAQFRALFDFIKTTRREGRIEMSYGCEGFLGSYETEVRDSFFFCKAGVNIASVLADGSISACPNLRANFIQGNIYKDDFMDVWNNRYTKFRDRSWAKTGECADCQHFDHCKGNGMHLRGEDGSLLFCHYNRMREGEKAIR